MPEYEFFCRSCGKRFTAFMHVKDHDVEVATCPECHDKRDVQKQIADVNVFTTRKSTGWR